ncbi:MAG: VWA domain-containing protein [Vicinamibacteraceae bacterium]
MILASVVGLLAQTPAGQPQPADLPTPRFRAEADVVVVEATVLDRKGVVVTGLGPADFKVEISGKPREVLSADLVEYGTASKDTSPDAAPPDLEITTNEPKENGRVILLVIDQASLGSETRSVIDSAKRWALALGPKDLLGLLTYPVPGPSVDFTADHSKIADALSKVVGIGVQAPPFQQYNISIWEAIRMDAQDLFVRGDVIGRECRANQQLCPTEVEMQVKTMVLDAQAQTQPVLRSLRATMRGLAKVPGPKHAVLLSSGWAMSERDASTEMGWVAADAARANVTIHTFTAEMWALAASRSRPSMRSIEDRTLLMNNVEMLASLTGGRSVRLAGQADTAFASLTAGLSGYYRLGVHALPDDLDGKDHRISLKLTRPGAIVASYRRVLSGQRAEAATPPQDPETALRAALKGGPLQTGVELRATSYVLHATASHSRDLRVVAVGDVGRAAAGTAKAVAALYDLDGKPVTAMENAVEITAGVPGTLSVELTAPPGTYVLRVAVRDADGKIGSLERLVDARWKKTGGIETPGLVLFRADRAVRGAPRPIFDHVTTADDVIAQVALSGPATEKKTQVVFEVTKAGGTSPLVRRAARIAQTTGGTTVAQETLPASMLPPGRYTLSARIGGATTALTRAFTVVASPAGTAPAPATAAGAPATPAGSGVPAVSGARVPARGTLSFATPRFATSTVLDTAFVTPLIDRLAARQDTAAVRAAIEQARAGPWPTDSTKGPLAESPLAAQFFAGLGHLHAGDLEEAAQAFRAALKIAPDFAPSLTYLGACYAAGAKDSEAAGAWQMALVRERTSPELQRLAIEAWLRADKPAAALALLNQARQRWPDDDAFVRLQAHVALADGRQQEGVDLVATLKQPDQATLLLALNTLYDAARRKTPVWNATRDLERMRALRDAYAAIQGESLALVDAWIAEMAREATHAPPR